MIENPAAIMIAGTSSGSGKTTAAMVIMHALKKAGFPVVPFKAGPDYIDPGYHSLICEEDSTNLDLWLVPEETVRHIFHRKITPDKFAVVEGVMGLYDGMPGTDSLYSSAHLAKVLDIPVVLVIDGSKTGDSVAAIALGFVNYDCDISIAGVIFNNISSDRHHAILEQAINKVGLKSFGYLPRQNEIKIKERHLGLKSVHEQDSTLIKKLRDFAESATRNIDLQQIINCSNIFSTKKLSQQRSCQVAGRAIKSPVRIAVARDKAFCFYYQDSLSELEDAGAELVYFSPLSDRELPDNINGIIFGGGFPEIFARQLSDNKSMIKDISLKARQGLPVYAECGGLIYIAKEFASSDGKIYEMAGLLNAGVEMNSKRVSLGYVEAKLESDCIMGRKGTVLRGHKFHWSSATSLGSLDSAYSVFKNGSASVADGFVKDNVFASYVHLHFSGCPEAAREFVLSCRDPQKQGVIS